MAYMRFAGSGNAFGWRADSRVTVGGLLPDAEYTLVCERESYPFRTDARGAWTGQVLHDVPLCIALDGRPVLYDESRGGAAAALALLAARSKPQVGIPVEPAEEAEQPEGARTAAETVKYRQASESAPVDALPPLIWPSAAEGLRPYFENGKSTRLLRDLSWRTVRAQEGGMSCCFGIRIVNDRVCEALYGVRARGGIAPPRGLEGYRFERMLDGGGYWTLRQRV
ncbi:MAG: hypothetical protein IJ157_09595 [Clostridia bacterium]|nr:hypothetical protein [Clostridia bacterium]